jgi:hypothetical protein
MNLLIKREPARIKAQRYRQRRAVGRSKTTKTDIEEMPPSKTEMKRRRRPFSLSATLGAARLRTTELAIKKTKNP